MTHAQSPLLSQIENFQIDNVPVAMSFERRLARENGWMHTYAIRVVAEYRRFIYLAMTADHPVTPSDQVDQAWHLHLTYTRSYWERLCTQVLPRPLHHEPTKGGGRECRKFDTWYTRTMEIYLAAFGEAPPSDIWPDSAVRFGDDTRQVRVNTARNWIIPKRRGLQFAAGLGIVLTGIASIGANTETIQQDMWCAGFGFAIVALVILLSAIATRSKTHRNGGSHDGGGCGFTYDDSHIHGDGGHDSGSADSGGGDSGCSASGCSSGCGGGGCGGGGCGS